MASYSIEFTRSAAKEIQKMPRSVAERIAATFPLLEESPTRARPGLGVKRLRGARGGWRLRVGDHRGIFEVEGRRVVFTRFGHRSRVYDA